MFGSDPNVVFVSDPVTVGGGCGFDGSLFNKNNNNNNNQWVFNESVKLNDRNLFWVFQTVSKTRTGFGPTTFQALVGVYLCLMKVIFSSLNCPFLPYSCHILRHEIPQLQFCFACHRRGQSVALPLNTTSGELDPALVRGGTFVWRSDEAHGIPRGRFGTLRRTYK